MSPAEIMRAAAAKADLPVASRRPEQIDLSDVPERPLGKGAERGKFAGHFRAFPLVEIEPDLAGRFTTAKQVNEALRLVLRLAEQVAPQSTSSSSRSVRKNVRPTN